MDGVVNRSDYQSSGPGFKFGIFSLLTLSSNGAVKINNIKYSDKARGIV